MTTIAYRNGLIASDSQTTTDSEHGGSRKFQCVKLYPKFTSANERVIIGTAGETFSGLIFVDWYGTKKHLKRLAAGRERGPIRLLTGDADFTAIVLCKAGLFEYDRWCRGEKIEEEYYAVGSGAKAALGAMKRGASAPEAVAAACDIDPYTKHPIIVMSLDKLLV